MQQEANGWRYQSGSSQKEEAWQSLFHQSKKTNGFENTKSVLGKLLDSEIILTPTSLDDYTEEYITSCERDKEFDWRFYYLKYFSCRPGSLGKYYWNNRLEEPYLFRVMQTKSNISPSTYSPYLYECESINETCKLSRETYGDRLFVDGKYIMVVEDGYTVFDAISNSEIERWRVPQLNGIDTEDRVVYLQNKIQLLMTQSNSLDYQKQ